MKSRTIITLFACTLFVSASAQTTDTMITRMNTPIDQIIIENPPPAPEKTYEMFDIEKPPEFPGGEGALMRFLAENIVYPDTARNNYLQGVVVATFVVGSEGEISNISIVKDIGQGCGKEVRRVLGIMPKWSPGAANGHPVRVRYTLPVRFKLTK